MSAIMSTAQNRVAMPDSDRTPAVRTTLAVAGAMLSLLGAVLAVGGYLSLFSGSAFYMFTGVALVMSGVLMAKRHRAGAWTYMVVFGGTLAWSLQEIDSGSSLAFRLIGPTILLAVLAALMPVLCNWRPRRAALTFLGLVLGTIAVGTASSAYQAREVCLLAAACDAADKIKHQIELLESVSHAHAY